MVRFPLGQETLNPPGRVARDGGEVLALTNYLSLSNPSGCARKWIHLLQEVSLSLHSVVCSQGDTLLYEAGHTPPSRACGPRLLSEVLSERRAL